MNTEQPLVSIIIPTYNRAHLIGETLDSVLAQTYQNWECIVVDDGSSDNTDEVVGAYVQKDARFKYYHRPDTHLPGGNGARNYGFLQSKGEYIQWFDSDDLMLNSKIELQIEELKRSNSKICVSNAELFLKKPKDSLGNWSKHLVYDNNVINTLIFQKDRWACGALLVKRNYSILWNEELLGGQEWLFNIELAIKYDVSEFCFLNKALLFIRSSNLSITRYCSESNRFSNYLYARVIMLKILKDVQHKFYYEYLEVTYNLCLKYIRVLINNNNFSIIIKFSELIRKESLLKYLKFWFGILIFRFFKKDFFLKKVF